MKQFNVPFIVLVGVLCMVLTVERVIGLPLISTLLFYHLFVGQQNRLVQGSALMIFSLVLASFYMISPLVIGILQVTGFFFLYHWSSVNTRSRSWNYVYMALVQASSIAILAGVVINVYFFAILVVQALFIFFFLRQVVFKGMSQVFDWKKEVVNTTIHEKKI